MGGWVNDKGMTGKEGKAVRLRPVSGDGWARIGGSDFNEGGEGLGDGYGFDGAIGFAGDADDDEATDGDFLGRAGFDAADVDAVGEGARTFFLNDQVEFHDFLEAEWATVIAGGMDAGESEGRLVAWEDDGKAEGSEEGVFDRFHVSEELGEVDDASHVGFVELDAAGGFELERHGRPGSGRSAGGEIGDQGMGGGDGSAGHGVVGITAEDRLTPGFAELSESGGIGEERTKGIGEGLRGVVAAEDAAAGFAEDFGVGDGRGLDEGSAGGEGLDLVEAEGFGMATGDREDIAGGVEGDFFLAGDIGMKGGVLKEIGGVQFAFLFSDEGFVGGAASASDPEGQVGEGTVAAESDEGIDHDVEALFGALAGEEAEGER